MNAGGASQLGQADEAGFDGFRGVHHQICEFVNENDNARQARLLLALHLAIINFKIADFLDFKDLVALIHFLKRPAKHTRHAVHVGFYFAQKVRQPIEAGQLHHLGVHHHQAEIGRGVIHHKAGGEGGDTDGFTGAGGTSDQEMRHPGKIGNNRLAGNPLPQRHCQWGLQMLKSLIFQDGA